MSPRRAFHTFRTDEDGGILLLWAITVVLFLGLLGLIVDLGRTAATQAELQSFADSVSLAAAAELDGVGDAIERARAAADSLITDSQTFAEGASALTGTDDVTLTFYKAGGDGRFSDSTDLVTSNPYSARYVRATVAERVIVPGFAAGFAALRGAEAVSSAPSATAAASFEVEACNAAPVAVCLPTVDFSAATSIGQTLQLSTEVDLSQLMPGNVALVDTLTDSLDGLSICVGLLGNALDACLLAARAPATACQGRGGLKIAADVDGSGLVNGVNTRFEKFVGDAAGLAGNPDFSAAPNVLTGLTDALGLCLPLQNLLPTSANVGLPVDDCLTQGSCTLRGDGTWTDGRTAYVAAHYNGVDPFPGAQTRYDFFRAEVAASGTFLSGGSSTSSSGGLLGGITNSFTPALCAPQPNKDPKRRLMVVAGIDCLSATVDATATVPSVQQFFEVFVLGPAENGKLNVEITACLGGGCGTGDLDTEVRDVVRLVE